MYIANLFFLTSDAWVPVVSDTDLNEETAEQYNLILVGSPQENSWIKQFHEKVPLKYESNTLVLGKYYGKFLDKLNAEPYIILDVLLIKQPTIPEQQRTKPLPLNGMLVQRRVTLLFLPPPSQVVVSMLLGEGGKMTFPKMSNPDPSIHIRTRLSLGHRVPYIFLPLREMLFKASRKKEYNLKKKILDAFFFKTSFARQVVVHSPLPRPARFSWHHTLALAWH